MNRELALLTLQKDQEKKKRRNELAKKMRERRGEELKEKNKEYARIHREKKKRELDEAMSIIKKEEKAKEPKEPKELHIKKDMVILEKDRGELLSKLERTGIKGVSEKTATDYINKISVIHRIISKDELNKDILRKILEGKGNKDDENKIRDNMRYMDNVGDLIKVIEEKYENIQSRKAYISSYMTLISYLPNIKRENYEKIRLVFEVINNEIYGIRGENVKGEKEEMIDSFDEEDIMRRANNLGIDDKIIYAFYTLQPPRRCDDVYNLIVMKEGGEIDKSKNYIIIGEGGDAKELIYNNYKTSKIYGMQKIRINNENLIEIIGEYIKKNDIKDGEKLYRRYSTAKTFGDAIRRIMTNIYGRRLTLNSIRHSYISWEQREQRSVNYLTNLAMMMGHSLSEQQLYRRI